MYNASLTGKLKESIAGMRDIRTSWSRTDHRELWYSAKNRHVFRERKAHAAIENMFSVPLFNVCNIIKLYIQPSQI
jgi:ABC-type multidrug transport system fused ATPase/permease subunit